MIVTVQSPDWNPLCLSGPRFFPSARQLVRQDGGVTAPRAGRGRPAGRWPRTNWRAPTNYRVVRLWKEDPQPYLTAGVNLVPLAPLTNVTAEPLPDLVRRMADRINAEPEPRAAKLWTATYLLMGLRVPDEVAVHLLEGVQNLRESTT